VGRPGRTITDPSLPVRFHEDGRDRIGGRWRDGVTALILAAISVGLLFATTALDLGRTRDLWSDQPKRFWEDQALAVGAALTGEFPVAYTPFVKERGAGGARYTEPRGLLASLSREQGIRPWEFWRTVPAEAFRRPHPPTVFRRFDDAGRALCLAVGFKLLGGVAPYLTFWLGLLLAAPLMIWVGFEFARAGHSGAGLVFAAIVGLSPFVAGVLALPYAGIGFYVLGILILVALSLYASLATPPAARGFWLRMAVGGLAFAACSLGRSSCLLLLPAIFAAIIAASRRLVGPRRLRAVAFASAGAVMVFLIPYVAADALVAHVVGGTLRARDQPPVPQQHPIWWNLWMGLGDFDREKGYVWADDVASAVAVRRGGVPIGPSWLDPRDERILRDMMLADILDDPYWYLRILARRTLATLTQWKLMPWKPWGGSPMRPRSHPNEGQIDAYYALTVAIDWVGIDGYRLEVPIPILIGPTAVLLAWCWRGSEGQRARSRRALQVVLYVGLGTVLLPIFVTTAGGIETEAFVLTYFLGLAFVVDEAARRRAGSDGSGNET
jgi:hypothetical protein